MTTAPRKTRRRTSNGNHCIDGERTSRAHRRWHGAAKADKKAERVAADGRVVVKAEGNKAVIVEVNSETDFVAKDENFIAFAEAVAGAALAAGQTDVAALADTDIGDGRTIEAARTELVQKVGENISVRRAQIVEADGPMSFYTHGARIGAIVALEGGDEGLARDIAMHVAAINPVCIDESGVPAETLETEKRIFTEQAEASGKPAEIIEKMVTGRVAKFLKEITLVGQPSGSRLVRASKRSKTTSSRKSWPRFRAPASGTTRAVDSGVANRVLR